MARTEKMHIGNKTTAMIEPNIWINSLWAAVNSPSALIEEKAITKIIATAAQKPLKIEARASSANDASDRCSRWVTGLSSRGA